MLTANPSECGFCMSGGPESMVEVKAKTGLKYSREPVVVKGRLELVKNDPGAGVFYRLHDAVPSAKWFSAKGQKLHASTQASCPGGALFGAASHPRVAALIAGL